MIVQGWLTGDDAFETRVGPQAIKAPKQPRLQGRAVEHFPGGHAMEGLRKANPQVRLFQDIQQTRHRPPAHEFGFHAEDIGWFWLWIKR